jgi:hypothetical protein
MGEEVSHVQKVGIPQYLEQQLHPDTIADSLIQDKLALAGLKTIRLSSRELLELYPPPKQAPADRAMEPAGMQGPPLRDL